MPPGKLPQANSSDVLGLEEGEKLNPYRWIILVGLITAAILEILDTTIVNVALPQMAGNLGATTEEIGWVATGYILSNVIVLPMTAWLSGHFGRKRYLTGSILLFIAASFFCGTSRSLGELVFWRVVQGSGGAALLSTCQATLREIFPRHQQGMVQGFYTLGVIAAPTLGPALGGWITDNYTWPWVFFVNVPIGLVSAVVVYLFLDDAPYQSRKSSVDWIGMVLLAAGLGSFQYVLEEGNRDDWFASPLITGLSVLAAVALVSMVLWELSPANKHPVVNFHVLKNRDLSASMLMFAAVGFGLYGGVFLFPLFSQNILNFTPTLTGLVLLPGGVASGFSAMISAKLLTGAHPRANPRYIILIGMGLFTYSMWDMAHMAIQSGPVDTEMILLVRGFALGFLFLPINLAALSSVKGPQIAQAASLMNLMRQLGGSFGIAVLGTFLSNQEQIHLSTLVQNVRPGNPVYQYVLYSMIHGMMAKGLTLFAAQKAAIGALNGMIQAQAATLAFDDAFMIIGVAMVVVAPSLLLMRSTLHVGARPGAAH